MYESLLISDAKLRRISASSKQFQRKGWNL